MKRKIHIVKNTDNSSSWFGEYAHRWPPAALPVGYAMALVETVATNLEQAGDIYQQIFDACGISQTAKRT